MALQELFKCHIALSSSCLVYAAQTMHRELFKWLAESMWWLVDWLYHKGWECNRVTRRDDALSFNHVIDLSAGFLCWHAVQVCHHQHVCNSAFQSTPWTAVAALIRLRYWFPPTAAQKKKKKRSLRLRESCFVSLVADRLHLKLLTGVYSRTEQINQVS